MVQNDAGKCTWTHTRCLYRSWGNLTACLKAFAIAIVICFVLITTICAFSDSDFVGTLVTQGKIWGVVLLGFELLAILGYYIWAWAQGGVDEWEYEMDEYGVKGRKVVHNVGRMKFLRGFACILLLAPGKPGQKMALRGLLYDNSKQTLKVSFADVKGFSGDETKGEIVFQTRTGQMDLAVPPDDYADILSYISERISKPKKRM